MGVNAAIIDPNGKAIAKKDCDILPFMPEVFDVAWTVVKSGPDSDEWKANRPEGESFWDTLEAARVVEEVRDYVEAGMSWMQAVQEVAAIYGVKGRDLARAYTEAYK